MERVALVKLNPLVREEISSYKRSLLTFVGHSILSDYILTFTLITPLFEKYLQIANAFHCIVKNRFPISLNRNSRQILDDQNFYPVRLPFYLIAEFKLSRIRIV